ncbi:hypothetical protein AVEN_257075-1 [Araneus ventricosus]|uniref:Uncharacterized protein n=1 Tax=Araneus ventricosus TaxID=182803 RepID=A0A4Y2GUG1_ARAVE|nr:hypothetical protein AVEN_257075-1 [Araneus ventricosus]
MTQKAILKKERKKKCDDIDRLVELMKVKLNSNLSKREKIQVLAIVPQSWSRKRVATEFNVIEYMAQKARKLALENRILAITGSRIVNNIYQEVKETAKFFYEDDEYSMMMPGAKDRVSVKKNEYKQKRLLSCNLKDKFGS